jgi:uncharacterized protein (DUF2147 family)
MTLRFVLSSSIIAITAVSAHAADPTFPIAGKWNTDWGLTELAESGGKVTGSFPFENGKIVGTRSENRLTAQWTQAKSARRCETAVDGNYFHGRIVVDITANEFVGKWGYCDDTPQDKWSGKRVSDSPIAGKWNTDWGLTELAESGGKVTGSFPFENGKVVGTIAGNRLTARWIQNKSSRRCDFAVDGNYFHGRVVFDFTGDEFVGKWGYCDDSPLDKLSGKRVLDSPLAAGAGGQAAAQSVPYPAPCPECPPWVSRSSSGNYLPLAAQAEVWSNPKPFKRKSGQMTVQSRFMFQKGTTCRFEVQFNNVDNKPIDENVLLGRPGKAAVSQYDHLIRIKLNPGTSYAFGTEVRECPPNWGETKEMEKCAACEPIVYFAAP